MNFQELTLSQARKGLKKKEFSSFELVKACLERIKKLNSKINAFITVCETEALKEARQADQIKDDLPLKGIPFAVKDNFCTRGIKTTAGSKVLENYFPPYNATVIEKLKQAGAIIIGKTNLDAWGHGASGENSDFGATRNPWNLDYVPGGSSSGSAAALAADFCLAAIGTDTAGSIRLPAAFCNLVGLKPTYGRVSRYGVVAMASSLDSIGHFTKDVYDSAVILNILAGKDSQDATTAKAPSPDYLKNLKKGIKGLKIGLPKEYFITKMNQEVEKKIRETTKKLIELGAQIIEVSLPHTQYAVATYYLIQPAEVSSNLARYDGIRYGLPRDKFGAEAKRRIMLGTYVLSAGYYDAYYLKAMKVRTLIKEDFEKAFEKVAVLLTPVSPIPAFKIGEKVNDPLSLYLCDVFTATVSLAGMPSLAIPVGFVKGLPVGAQLIGPQFNEERLFQVGYAYQQVTDWHKKRPKLTNEKE